MQSFVQLTRWPNALARQKKDIPVRLRVAAPAHTPQVANFMYATAAGLGDRLVNVGGSTVHRGESGLSADKIEIRVS